MYAVIDFETTSRNGERRPTEIAIAVLDAELEVLEEYQSLINPTRTPYQESLGYSRLTLKELKAAPSFEELWPEIARLLSGKLIVMHNREFDLGALANAFEDMGLDVSLPTAVCTLEASRQVFAHRQGKDAHSLGGLLEELGFDTSDAHQAMDDVRMTVELFRHLMKVSAEFSRTCEILLEDAQAYSVTGTASAPVPRVRYKAGGKSEAELEAMANEIRRNAKVQSQKIVCLTGSLNDFDAMEQALAEAGYSLEDKETTKGTAFLIQGARAGVRKVTKAIGYGRPVLTEDEAWQLLEHLLK